MAKTFGTPTTPRITSRCRPKNMKTTFVNLSNGFKKPRRNSFGETPPRYPKGPRDVVVGDSVKYNEIAAKIMKENGVEIEDVYALVKPKMGEWMQPKGNVHFNKVGSQVIARDVAAAILKALGS